MPLSEVPPPADPTSLLSRSTLQALQLGVWGYAPATRSLRLGPQAHKLIGPMPSGGGLDQLLAVLTDDSARRLRRAFIACLREGAPIDAEVQLKPRDERRPWLRFIGEKTPGAQAQPEAIQGFVQDISARKQAQEDTVRLAMRLTTTLASITEAFVALDTEGRFTYLNPESERLLKSSTAELLDEPIWGRLRGQHDGLLQEQLTAALQGNRRARFEDFYPALGLWVEITAHPYIEGLAVYFRDISERKAAEAKIHRLAFYDTLTGLPNRQFLIEQLEQALADSARTGGGHGALLFIDLDNFKTLNDTRGHATGDLLLKRMGERLRASMRQHDVVARIGGDEFVVILRRAGASPRSAQESARAAASKALASLAAPFDLDGYQHHSTVSIGVALFDGGHPGVSELLKQADLAMYQAKHLGRNTLAFFEPAMLDALNARVALAHDMRAALESGGQFALHYQPQFDRAGRMVGAEALLRWQHPELGLVLPAQCIPIAEDTGLVIPLGRWVLQQACRQLADWRQRPGTAALTLSVNVSARQFRLPDFVEQVMACMAEHATPPDRLRLELTESLLSEQSDATQAQMRRLRECGVGLSLDDFGTGYSSLMYLKRLPLNELKIDKAFVDGVLTDPADAAIVQAIIGTAHSLHLQVIAEGVETEAQRQFLSGLGCDCFQGHLLARPMAIGPLEAFMASLPARATLAMTNDE